MCPQVQRQWYRKRILQTGWLKIGPKTRPHFGWNRCAQNRCGVPMHQARGLEKHLPNKLVEDVARRASLTDPPLEETDLFRSSVCFQVQRQGSRKRILQTGWLKRVPRPGPTLDGTGVHRTDVCFQCIQQGSKKTPSQPVGRRCCPKSFPNRPPFGRNRSV